MLAPDAEGTRYGYPGDTRMILRTKSLYSFN